MAVDRVKFQDIVASQIPDFVRDDFPLLVEFLEQYYVSQEYQSGTYDLIQNIDKYVKVDELFNLKNSTSLAADISYTDTSISTGASGNFTVGFPDRDGLIKIDNEIIYYEYKTDTTFEGCVRGFSAVTSYTGSNTPDELVFSTSEVDEHTSGASIYNLNILFLQEFFKKLKSQFVPGFDERTLYSGLDQRNFIFNADSFYSSKGTDQSFEILFRALYGEDVEVIKPSEYLIRPSNANYKVTKDYVIETIQGNPLDLKNRTLFQDSTGAKGSVSNVRPVRYNDTQYYQVSIDFGYQRDIDVRGSIFGEFKPNSKTKILNSVSVGSTVIDVDSTVGFPESGNLITTDIDDNIVTLTYSGKSDNQFFNVSGLNSNVSETTDIRENEFAYAYVGSGTDNQIQVRIASTLKELKLKEPTYYFKKDDTVRVQSLGIETTSEKTKNWKLNVKTNWQVRSIVLVDSTERTYTVTTYESQFTKPGYTLLLKGPNANTEGSVVSVLSGTSFIVKLNSLVNTSLEYTIENQTLNPSSSTYPYLEKYIANVQNIYSKFDNDLLVASNSLPNYDPIETNPYNKSVKLNGTYSGETITSPGHGFLTGDSVYYKPGITKTNTTTPDGNIIVVETESKFSNIDEGVYFVRTIDPNSFKLARSRSDLFSDTYLFLNGTISNNTITYYNFYNKTLEPQKIYRNISSPANKSGYYPTEPGFTGILINGVEILNYKSPNKIIYGDIKGFNIFNRGKGYDIINPPSLRISDAVGTGATGIVAVRGQLERIDVLDPGFDYQNKPFVKITGGNGKNASAEVRISAVDHSVPFYTDVSFSNVSLGSSTIGFGTFHKFRDNEKVVYVSDGQRGVGGLSTDAFYYVGVVDSQTIKLYKTEEDSVVGINTVALTGYGTGSHRIKSTNRKNVVTSVVVTNPGSGYENKQRKIVGINTAVNQFTIYNHGYSSKEIVRYSTTGTPIQGLSASKDYYVVKIDNDKFSLIEVGSGNTTSDYYYNNNVIVNVKSQGDGSFNYKPITVTIEGVTGVSTRAGQDFSCKVVPVFRGEIDSIDVTSGGIGYGSSEILNFDRQPVVTLFSGKDAVLIPVVDANGQISDVLVNSGGSGYNSPPDLRIISSTGKNAALTPVIRNGSIVEVKVIKKGAGYVPNKTSIIITPAGSEATIDCKIFEWNVNLFERNFSKIQSDDGFLEENISNENLQYAHIYAPRALRETTYAISGTKEDNTLYGTPDLNFDTATNKELVSKYHSPIIGWAYDGNPIYGPYGFTVASGSGFVKAMQPGYELISSLPSNRPSSSIFPLGFFVEDYVFTSSGDLDEHNGRFCVTPDYPNGVYAYFATINSITDSSGPFTNYRRPVFPYLIGNTYSSVPNDFNFRLSSNQNEYDLESNDWFRNTTVYHINGAYSGYDYIFDSNDEKEQTIDITSASIGSIESVGIITGGTNYKVNDKVIFDNSGTGGRNENVRVRTVKGKKINTVSVATSTIYNVEFLPSGNPNTFTGLTTQPHNLKANDIVNISGLSNYFKGFDGNYNVGLRTDNFILNLGVSSATSNQVDYFYVSGALFFPYIRENDILNIGSEKVKVLNVDSRTSRIRVLRGQDGTVATAHTNSTPLYENSRKFSINVGSITTTKTFDYNRDLYFDPSESVGIGTILGTGVGTTITFSNPGVGLTQVFVEPQTIYYPSHGLKLNDPVSYRTNSGTSIQAWDGKLTSPYTNLTAFSSLYAVPITKDILGIGTHKVGLDSTGSYIGINTTTGLLYFTNVGVGDTHSFKTNLPNVISGELIQNRVTVSTASTHGLKRGDKVNVTVKPTNTVTVTVKYNDHNGRIIFNPRSFTALDVNVTQNYIEFSDKYFEFGDKVLHTSSSPSGGLENEGIYYTVPFNDTKVRLVRNKYELNLENPNFVDITSASTGSLSKINPLVNVKRNNALKFDLSDSSLRFVSGGTNYSAFDMNLYTDRDYSNIFFTSGKTDTFEVIKTGRPGIDANANLTLTVSDDIPSNLYYKFDLDNLDLITSIKSGISTDKDVSGYNSINVVKTQYDGVHTISGIGSTYFQYNIPQKPDVLLYNDSNSVSSYVTDSRNVLGPIHQISVLNGGSGFRELPAVTGVRSGVGSGAILYAESRSIGNILSNQFEDIGYDLPTDKTVRAVANLPELLKIQLLTSFDRIGITSSGKNYLVSPTLVVLDGYNNRLVSELDAEYSIGDTEVTILKNTTGLYNVTPRIIPTQNSNGVGISSVIYNSSTKVVRIYLASTFSDAQDFRFRNGSRVLIENLSVGVGSTGKGYNSQNYGYELFEITNSDSQLGGSGAWFEYSLSSLLSGTEIPGNIDFANSAGRAIPEVDFPIFDISLKKNNFFIGEKVRTGTKVGIVERWNLNSEQLVISTVKEFTVGSTLIGESSNTQGVVESKIDFNAEIITGAGATFVSGWHSNSGFLNNNLQRIPNNEYYQNLSYSLKSKVPYETWNDSVSALNHTSGFAKFADYVVESIEDQPQAIAQPKDSATEIIVDIIGQAKLNCFYDFDFVGERTIDVDGNVISTEIVFENRILSDYFESVGNRALSIDDISGEFNSTTRATNFSTVASYALNNTYNKIFTFVQDQVLSDRRQANVVTVLQRNNEAFMQEYGSVETVSPLGTFDYSVSGSVWNLLFYPNSYEYNSYYTTTVSFSTLNDIVGVGSTALGDVVNIFSSQANISAGATTNIIQIDTSYRSSKHLVLLGDENGEYASSELNIIHDGSNVQLLEYADMQTTSGFGTFNAYISGGNVLVDFIPSVGVAITANTSSISIANTASSGLGSITFYNGILHSGQTSIAATTSPVPVVIDAFSSPYDSEYYIISVEDLTNNSHEMFEVVSVYGDAYADSHFAEFANISTGSSIGQVGIDTASNEFQLTYTPNVNTEVQVRVFGLMTRIYDLIVTTPFRVDLNNADIHFNNGFYTGSLLDVKTAFGLKHDGLQIFNRPFDGSNSSIVDVNTDSIFIANHFFVTGEEVTYTSPGAGTTSSIGISTISVPGIGLTDKLPSTLYVIAPDDKTLKFATTAQNALARTPSIIDLTSVGLGAGHSITSKNQNSKVLLAVDNMIQSPVVSSGVTSVLNNSVTFDTTISLTGITSFYPRDHIKVNDEIMFITSVDRTTNTLGVRRAQLGSPLESHSPGETVYKLAGNYNIVENTLHFVEAPKGNNPVGVSSDVDPDNVDWTGISTSSTFQGRSFMRSGIVGTSSETYTENYIYDNISGQFTGIRSEFSLTVNGSNITGIETQKGIVLINGIFQEPNGVQPPSFQQGDYTLTEKTGITSITFTGNDALPSGWDPNNGAYPIGGLIVSVASSNGFGYQPLVAAGGTAIVSIAGTISSISIGNSGSGYRAGIQTVVNVGVQTYSSGVPNIEFIGTAAISGGNIVSVTITNPGSGYTVSNPPEVVFDSPLNYDNIPLQYSSSSLVGSGQSATVDIVVGSGSSVLSFEFQNYGFGYGAGEILTIPVGGLAGIPTDPSATFREFQITIDEIFTDTFSAWGIGTLEVLDSLDSKFDGVQTNFNLSLNEDVFSVRSRRGSKVDVEQTLLVFINDILQEPGKAYTFKGGSVIKFTEPPKEGDSSKLIFYKGTGGVDVDFVNILETVKVGDSLDINNNPDIGQGISLDQNERVVIGINTVDTVATNAYTSPGVTTDRNLLRPVTWCKQNVDKVVNGSFVGKDRIEYEPLIYPEAYIIQPVGYNSTFAYVDNLRPIFDSYNEAPIRTFQNVINIVSQDSIVQSTATAVVSTSGTVSSITITNPGFGYTQSPQVTIANPVGLGTTQRASATASITSGIVTTITITSPGTGYTSSNPPVVLIEAPKLIKERIDVTSYVGDYGIIVGVGTTVVSAQDQLIFDLFIPKNSFMRNSGYVGSAVTISGISTGDYLTVYDTNISIGASFASQRNDGSSIGVGTTFLDFVYQAESSEIRVMNVVGVGVTYVKRIFVNVDSFGSGIAYTSTSNLGNFSWGKMTFDDRSEKRSFNFYGQNGYSGISTSAIVMRNASLKSDDYVT